MSRTSSVLVTLLLLVPTTGSLSAQTPAKADAKALEAARELVAKRTPLADVASQMQRTYRQSAAQASAIFVALRTSSAAAAPAVMKGYGLKGSDVTAALLGGGYSHSATVSGARQAGVRVVDMTAGFRSARVAPRDVARAYRDAGLSEQETLTGFRGAGVDIAEAAKATQDTYPGSAKRLAKPLELAGYPTSLIYRLYKELEFAPGDLVSRVRADGKDWQEAADLVEDQFGLSDAEVGAALLEGGYTFEAPVIDDYRIADFRRLGSGSIENLGIVDPDRMSGGSSPLDGTVTISGDWLDLPGTRVRMVHEQGVTEGVVTRRSGGAGSSNLEVELEGFGSGELVVETLGGVASMPAVAISYHALAVTQVFNPRPTLILGGGEGSLVYGFSSGAADIPQAGSVGDLIHPVATAVSDEPTLSVTPSSNWDLTVTSTHVLTPLISGTWSVPQEYWACGSFEIPVSTCSPLSAACVAEELGSAFQSALACTNPANWEKKSQPGPPLPLMAQGVGVVSYTAHIDLGTGGLTSQGGTPEYTCTIMPTDPASAPMAGPLQAWSDSNLRTSVTAANEGFHDAVLDRLGNWQLFLPQLAGSGAELKGAYGPMPNKVILEFHY